MPFSQQQIEEFERQRRALEEGKRSFTRRLIEGMGLWRHCDVGACLRERTCTDPALCAQRYADAILQWQRSVVVPYLRKRYPTVSWGAPLAVTEPQIEAARAAERARESNQPEPQQSTGGQTKPRSRAKPRSRTRPADRK